MSRMKKIASIIIILASLHNLVGAKEYADFVISDILVLHQDFIHIKIENRSFVKVLSSQEQLNKPFLVIYINNIKRAEYKLKYMDQQLFLPNSRINFRTNFRVHGKMQIKAEVNGIKIIPESNYKNNILTKMITSQSEPNG